MGKVYTTESIEETKKLASQLARSILINKNSLENFRQGVSLQGCRVVALYGDLGSGKTTFVQGLAKGLGITKRIISPTFVIVRQYKVSPPRSPFGSHACQAGELLRPLLGGGEATTSTPARCNTFYHVDLYRLSNERDVEGLGLEEIINNPQNIVAIEWAEKMEKLLPKERIDVKFEYVDGKRRKIIIWRKI